MHPFMFHSSIQVIFYFFSIRYCGSRGDLSDNLCSLSRKNAFSFSFFAKVLVAVAEAVGKQNENFLDTPSCLRISEVQVDGHILYHQRSRQLLTMLCLCSKIRVSESTGVSAQLWLDACTAQTGRSNIHYVSIQIFPGHIIFLHWKFYRSSFGGFFVSLQAFLLPAVNTNKVVLQ